MSYCVAGRALRIAATAGLLMGTTALAGCSSLGLGLGGGDVTGSVSSSGATLGQQSSMPPALTSVAPSSSTTLVAAGPFVPPENIGGGSGGFVTGSAPAGLVSSSALPPLSGSQIMPAQSSLAPVQQTTASLGTLPSSAPAAAAAQTLSVVPDNAYVHVIESGESLYTIARRYNTTAQAIVGTNNLGSPDKIFVGQKIIIPSMTAKPPVVAPVQTASTTPMSPIKPAQAPAVAEAAPAPAAPAPVAAAPAPAPVKTATATPEMSGADKFRWPVSGKVITDFIASKGTGINIEVPEGTPIRAAENGQVIYVGSGVEGFGNLILVRHANGYVSAYAHLKNTTVAKGDNVLRGDNIGTAGMTGSVSRPQLHFELRKGATPVDPIPLLAG